MVPPSRTCYCKPCFHWGFHRSGTWLLPASSGDSEPAPARLQTGPSALLSALVLAGLKGKLNQRERGIRGKKSLPAGYRLFTDGGCRPEKKHFAAGRFLIAARRCAESMVGRPTAPDRACLWLLPSGPDQVHSRPVHRARPWIQRFTPLDCSRSAGVGKCRFLSGSAFNAGCRQQGLRPARVPSNGTGAGKRRTAI